MSDKEKINKAFDEEYIKYRAAFPKDYDIPALAQTEQEPQIAINAQVVGYVKPQRTEPICPECKAEVLYECVACSSNNYPAQPAQPAQLQKNFCPQCGKRTADPFTIHTCTPPKSAFEIFEEKNT